MRAVALGMVLLCLVSGCIMEFDFSVPTIELVQIPAGKFLMGERGRAVEVTLTKPFWLGKSEVTQRQWQQVMGTKPWIGGGGPWYLFYKLLDYGRAANIAATHMDWNEATAFCDKLTAFERRAGKLKANEAYRLPTEAEWEYACRAGTTTAYSFDDASQLGEYAWFKGNTVGEQYAHAVGMKKPNPWGLYDMHGNVYEWCSDWGDVLRGGTDPVGPGGAVQIGVNSISGRVGRGGSWKDHQLRCESACRDLYDPSLRRSGGSLNGEWLGFRVARSQSAQ